MSVLDGFVNYGSQSPVYLAIGRTGIRFGTEVVRRLQLSEYVSIFVNVEAKQFAVKACGRDDPNALLFYSKIRKKDSFSVTWVRRDLMKDIAALAGWDLTTTTYRVEGRFFEAERTVVFDLAKATEM